MNKPQDSVLISRNMQGRKADPPIEPAPIFVLLPQQEIAELRRQPDYQNLAFHVYHALAAHRPPGSINRVRRLACPVSSAWRRRKSRVTFEVLTNSDEGGVPSTIRNPPNR